MTPNGPDRNDLASRRRFLRGLGAAVALPALDTFLPRAATAAMAGGAGPGLGVTATGAPLRMAFLYFANGVRQDTWWPGKDGGFSLNKTMAPLEGLKGQVQVVGGLDHLNATAGKDGGGDHARASSTFLTGVRVKKTSGADIHAGVSVDQLAARKIGHLTRFPSLELTCDGVRKSGPCDTGYSCAYDYNISWRTPTTPVAPESNPRLVFERLFGAGAQGERKRNLAIRREQQKSILDFVMDDATRVHAALGGRDKQKLDEYLTGVREIERRIEQAEKFGDGPDPAMPTPSGIPSSHRDHIDLMADMLVLAFQTDSTRIATMILAHDGSNRAFPEIGIPEGHHSLSHHQNKPDALDKYAKIDLFYMEAFARFLQKLDRTKDVDGKSILHNSMIVYGCGNGDGNRHNHDNLPVILAGGGGGSLNPGRFLKLNSQPMSNLFLGMLDRVGVRDEPRFGDSTGRLDLI
ncbi:DUF1552 domain-containing protein [Tundrisphaera sp. TA3]|uniref:DUF1552 domain-containing protein n=1 Tax=Tundrisphaera sp. TA3 TaxID=3435775 RepID=UPI003EB9DB49